MVALANAHAAPDVPAYGLVGRFVLNADCPYSGAARLVALTLADGCIVPVDAAGGKVFATWISNLTLVQKTGLAKRTVQKALKEITGGVPGLPAIFRCERGRKATPTRDGKLPKGSGKAIRSNLYTLLLPKVQPSDAPVEPQAPVTLAALNVSSKGEIFGPLRKLVVQSGRFSRAAEIAHAMNEIRIYTRTNMMVDNLKPAEALQRAADRVLCARR